MTDALLKACETIDSSIQEFLMLPLESTPLALQQQAACLQKLQAVASVFAATRWEVLRVSAAHDCQGALRWHRRLLLHVSHPTLCVS